MAKKKRYHHGNLKQALVEAALVLIKEKGPLHFTLREAARYAGVAPSAPYRHFENKQALMTTITEEGVRRLTATMTEEMESVSGKPASQFQAMGIGLVKFAVANPSHFRVMYIPEYYDPASSESLQEAIKEQNDQIYGLLNQMEELGNTGEIDVNLFFLTAHATTYGLARMFVDGEMERVGIGIEMAEYLARAVTDVLDHGLAPRNEVTNQSIPKNKPKNILPSLKTMLFTETFQNKSSIEKEEEE